MISLLLSYFSHDIGIDLGTANTQVFVRGKGITISEPSVVAIHNKTKVVLAIGVEAKKMVGKTPANISAIRPLRDGVISDFETTEKMLSYFIKKVHDDHPKLINIPRPRVVIGIPSSITEVERRAVHDAARKAGAREVYLIEEPMAAAIGSGLPIEEPTGNMVVDIGGGTTEIAVISLGGIVINKSIRVAGDNFDEEIISYIKTKHSLLIGQRTAEEAKISIGSAILNRNEEYSISGRDLSTGLPNSLTVTSDELCKAMKRPIDQIIEAIKDAIEETPPELIADIRKRGITLAGGGANLWGLNELIQKQVATPVHISDDPLGAVVRGTGVLLENLDLLRKVQILSKELS